MGAADCTISRLPASHPFRFTSLICAAQVQCLNSFPVAPRYAPIAALITDNTSPMTLMIIPALAVLSTPGLFWLFIPRTSPMIETGNPTIGRHQASSEMMPKIIDAVALPSPLGGGVWYWGIYGGCGCSDIYFP